MYITFKLNWRFAFLLLSFSPFFDPSHLLLHILLVFSFFLCLCSVFFLISFLMLCKYIILNIYIDFLTPSSSSSSTSFSRILYLLMLRFLRFFTHKFQFIFCFLRFFVFVLRLKFKHI